MKQSLTVLWFLVFTLSVLKYAAGEIPNAVPNLADKKEQKSTKLPPCKACSVLVESFKKGIEQTARGKHEGGDAAWEEEKMRSYKTSEVRLVEIQESLCSDVLRGQDHCHLLANENEHLIEEWWFNHQTENPDIFPWLCIDQMKVCCPPETYGPNCDPCIDCKGNGKCKGNGTRKGNGKCLCDTGYTGENCNACDDQFYEAFRDDSKLLCSPCHVACSTGGCSGPSAKACETCKNGWRKHPEYGCFDVNECIENKDVCKKDQFCVNNEGSFTCLECDKSCDGCTGDGPDLCDKCAEGFDVRDGKCTVPQDNSYEEEEYDSSRTVTFENDEL